MEKSPDSKMMDVMMDGSKEEERRNLAKNYR
jgi:hypothetical protein